MSFASGYRVGVWFDFVGSALLLAVLLCWVDCCLGFLGVVGLTLVFPCCPNPFTPPLPPFPSPEPGRASLDIHMFLMITGLPLVRVVSVV